MEHLTTADGLPDGLPVPGPHESWRELAEHSAGHDQLSTAVRHPDAFRDYAARRLAEIRAGRPAAR